MSDAETTPPATSNADATARLAELNKSIHQAGQQIITNNTLLAAGAGAIPVPLLDIAGHFVAQLNMIRDLSTLHGREYSAQRGRAILTAIAARAGAQMWLKPAMASMFKAIPGVGTAVGSIAAPLTSAVTTYALGQMLHLHFSSGGDLHSFDADAHAASFDFAKARADVRAQLYGQKAA